MAIQPSQFHCPTCRRATMHVRNEASVNHVLHLPISLFLKRPGANLAAECRKAHNGRWRALSLADLRQAQG